VQSGPRGTNIAGGTTNGDISIELGQGTVDLISAKEAAMEVGVDWVVCEQDTTEKEVKVSITESREYLRTIGW